MTNQRKFKVACVQATPAIFDLDKSLEKVIALTGEAAGLGCKLVVFPETFIPGYPAGLGFGTVFGSRTKAGRNQFREYWQNSVEVPGVHTDKLAECAKENGVFLTVGVTERDKVSKTLYCTLLYFGPGGSLLGKHRKLKPTAAERLVWGEGDGSTLCSFDTEIGRIGGLICWENYMPLARYALYAQNIDIYVAPTWDSGDTWLATMQHIAREGGCWVIGCATALEASDIPTDIPHYDELFPNKDEWVNPGDAVVYKPFGGVHAGPMHQEKGMLIAEINVEAARSSRRKFDASGHYARPDVFSLSVNRKKQAPVTFT